jgi:L-asparaginase II
MAEPIRVAARRGDFIESVHRVHAVAMRDGRLVEHAGDSTLTTSLRSSAKPLQALPLAVVEDRASAELAIACASHQAEPAQLEAVRALLEAAEASEDDLICGSQQGRSDGPLHHNCSGKHAGMLFVCLVEGWPKDGYHLADHPLQEWILDGVSDTSEVATSAVAVAIDGCGVPCYALPLDRVARAFELLDGAPGGDRVVKAMRAHPDLVGGEGAIDTDLMRAFPNWIAKRGAEGLLAAASPDGLGVALKVEDGSARALRPALGAFLEQLGLEPGPFGPVELRNSRDDVVGSLAAM